MPDAADQMYLLNEQYKNSANLNARIQLHERFSTNKYDWYRWVFDHFKIAPGSHILELGCGPARLWLHNLDRISDSWTVTLSDFSPGMLQEAQHNLQASHHPFTFAIIDAQSIPFDNESLDIVIANHMLYHTPDRAKALREIRRVLKPHGRLYATTTGQTHMRELDEMIRLIEPTYGVDSDIHNPFSLENGQAQLAQWFSHVTQDRFANSLVVTEVDPLIAYILSSATKSVLDDEKMQQLREIADQELATHGAIRVHKDSGIFEALV